MSELSKIIKEIRKKSKPWRCDPSRYISSWTEKEVLNGKIVDASTIILRTRGCAWALESGCSMCGYINDAMQKAVSDEDILQQFSDATKNLKSQKIVKIFTSGSFFDEGEISIFVKKKIIEILADKVKKISVESRPEYISGEKLKPIIEICENKDVQLEVSIGLESATDKILEHSINKNLRFADYLKATDTLKKNNVLIKTYLLLKPPFLTEREATIDALNSVRNIRNISNTISLNPVNIQNHTLVEYLWHRGEYSLPWLWSLVEVLKESSKITNVRLLSTPSGAGTKRGVHNCGKCDGDVLKAVQNFSLYGNVDVFGSLYCDCKEEWYDMLELEHFARHTLYRSYD
jgi:radical SAM enzyme (TIGR01210 family)